MTKLNESNEEVCVGIEYSRLTALLVEAVKSLTNKVNTLQSQLASLSAS